MIILNVDRISKNFGYGQLFQDVSFSLNEGESISIAGANGCGKSTILKAIMGYEKVDSGSINIKKGAKVAYLDQTGSSIKDDRCVFDILKGAFSALIDMEKRLNELQNKLSENLSEEDYNTTMINYCDLMEKFALDGGYDIDFKINTVVEGLKIDKNILSQSYDSLSGGEKTLVQLAKALLMQPDLFLLDEPTNHLDIDRIEWLENYLKSFKGATVIVSHDRYFLDRMSNKILSLDNGKAKVYATNYSGFLQEKDKEYEKQMAEFKDQQLAMKRIEEQIKYFAQMGMSSNSSTLCDRAHSLQTKLERMKKEAVARPKEQRKLNVEFEEERKSSKRIIVAEDFSVSVPNGKQILNNVNVEVCSGERVAILGANGSGKSTFIKAVMGVQDLPMQGEIYVGPSVKIGYLPQIIEFSNDSESVLEYFKREVGITEQKARQILANFQFYKEDVNKRIQNLSEVRKLE